MNCSRRTLIATVASLAATGLRGSSAAASESARRRLGALARRSLPRREVDRLLRSEAVLARLASPAELAERVRREHRTGRTLELGGVRFARSEVAMFLRDDTRL